MNDTFPMNIGYDLEESLCVTQKFYILIEAILFILFSLLI